MSIFAPSSWYFLGETTLGSAGDTVTVSGFPAYNYLKIGFYGPNSGSTRLVIRFNNDSGSNYATRTSTNGGADATATGQSGLISSASASSNHFFVAEIINFAANDKTMIGWESESADGAGTAPGRVEVWGKWNAAATQITRVDAINDQGGDWATGATLTVWGAN